MAMEGEFFKFPSERMRYIEAKYQNGTNTGPLIIDKREKLPDGHYPYFSLNQPGGLIVRFLVQGVRKSKVKEIYIDTFGGDGTEVDEFIDALANRGLIIPYEGERHENVPPSITEPKSFADPLYLHFDVGLNQMGGGGYKIPPW